MQVVAGSFPTRSGYAVVPGAIAYLGKSWAINKQTVESVQFVTAGTAYNYAKGGTGMMTGALIAGPVGMLVGGLLPKVFKDSAVRFVILFKDGRQAHCVGTTAEYERILKYSLRASYVRDEKAGRAPKSARPTAERLEPSLTDRDRLRSELAARKPARERPEKDPATIENQAAHKAALKEAVASLKADSKARRKAILAQGLSYSESMRQMTAINQEYREQRANLDRK